ncbi:MAG: lytic murein transglycosylase [Mesorhizobium sp.]|nr:lytic murein transglycosylase [Mesorhizobium sp. M4A.F.Ca.ET.022.05.2.1]RWD03069.1 MAG: lytic murein transglycosylase [Mesorhizobium sp.]TIW33049.1 MAG: lytic murein transglycosylase [Mesorhizobium sp.]
MPSLGTPLWPAGHLPLKGQDWIYGRPSPIIGGARGAAARELPISPLEGEMAGRPEGGAS